MSGLHIRESSVEGRMPRAKYQTQTAKLQTPKFKGRTTPGTNYSTGQITLTSKVLSPRSTSHHSFAVVQSGVNVSHDYLGARGAKLFRGQGLEVLEQIITQNPTTVTLRSEFRTNILAGKPTHTFELRFILQLSDLYKGLINYLHDSPLGLILDHFPSPNPFTSIRSGCQTKIN